MTEDDEFYHIFIHYSAVMNTKNIMISRTIQDNDDLAFYLYAECL